MLAFSAVAQLPTKGLSTRAAGMMIHESNNADHIMTPKTCNIRIAWPDPAAFCTLLERRAIATRQTLFSDNSAGVQMPRRYAGFAGQPEITRFSIPRRALSDTKSLLIW